MSAAAATAAATTAAMRAAVERGDVEGTLACFAPDVVLHSPITNLTRFEGRDELRPLLAQVYPLVQDVRYTQDVGDEEWRALFYTAKVGGVRVDEATRVRLDAQGRIAEVWLYFRPLSGLTELTARLAGRLARRRSPLNGLLVALMLRPLALLMRVGDGIVVRLAGLPRRPG